MDEVVVLFPWLCSHVKKVLGKYKDFDGEWTETWYCSKCDKFYEMKNVCKIEI